MGATEVSFDDGGSAEQYVTDYSGKEIVVKKATNADGTEYEEISSTAVSSFTSNTAECYEDGTLTDGTLSDGILILGCECHSSCGTCGFNDAPTNADDCITCADGSTVQQVAWHTDGTGTCGAVTTTASAAVVVSPLISLLFAALGILGLICAL